MSIWRRISDFITTTAADAFSSIIEAVRTAFEGDPETRRRVAFSIAMIALSAKMAKADGIVSQAEINAFHQIFHVPAQYRQQVERLYNLAKQDVAGYEAYAAQLASLCGSGQPNCQMLEDVLDGLFYIAKADGALHDQELIFLGTVAEIFQLDEAKFDSVLARHVGSGRADPFLVLGLPRNVTFDEARKRYRSLVRDNHPDVLVARGVPEEFIAIANQRLAAINAAWEQVEKDLKAYERV
ncbi:DnaJ family molecular chaperone [Phyllobacterium sp. 21LDTY02-6]|jgi:DnaJ like chaperone protein|uniref:J domain-containing protein n=1 Tax=unclassified Phyllobacterium TaxID=2638441 RepID=UPI0020216F07|nr:MULTISPECIES: DnaJ family molecular chaperone [unclassified Phyllobacterium]MCO4315962.1 DnaJ family molecular chaperone [Phyllobacterium sp. 21LDTY02-6]MCX8279614.1 DnaJ family molecular chaperone [Phyllobacterium sp. 0TCS1.6C]MCX8292195.1 DnaJ family molecular chaperone [Phyllobacterium sp. 0TCS1.6A]